MDDLSNTYTVLEIYDAKDCLNKAAIWLNQPLSSNKGQMEMGMFNKESSYVLIIRPNESVNAVMLKIRAFYHQRVRFSYYLKGQNIWNGPPPALIARVVSFEGVIHMTMHQSGLCSFDYALFVSKRLLETTV